MHEGRVTRFCFFITKLARKEMDEGRAARLLALSHSCFSARKFDLFDFFYLYVFLEYDGVYILVYHVVKNNEQQDSDKTSALKSKRDLRKR